MQYKEKVMDIAELRNKLNNIAAELAEQDVQQEDIAIEEEQVEEDNLEVEESDYKLDPETNKYTLVSKPDQPTDMRSRERHKKGIEKSMALKDKKAQDDIKNFISSLVPDEVKSQYKAAFGEEVEEGSRKDDEEHELEKLIKGSPIDIDASGPMKPKKMKEEEVEEATVEIPVQELADIMQLAGYTDYAQRIEEYANEPDEQYMDAEDQLIGLSGGLNGPKNMHTPAADGDNPMDKEALKTVEENLYKSYQAFLEEAEINQEEE